MIRNSRVALLGFMGAGKTTVAKALAERTGCVVVDVDEQIAANTRATSAEIIKDYGVRYFRKLESNLLDETLRTSKAEILSLAGGTWLSARNRKALDKAKCLSVWLDVPFPVCWDRISVCRQEVVRPLAHDYDIARALFTKRRAVYDLADVRIDTECHQDVDSIVDEISFIWQKLRRDAVL